MVGDLLHRAEVRGAGDAQPAARHHRIQQDRGDAPAVCLHDRLQAARVPEARHAHVVCDVLGDAAGRGRWPAVAGVEVCQLAGSVAVTGCVVSVTRTVPISTLATPVLAVTVE